MESIQLESLPEEVRKSLKELKDQKYALDQAAIVAVADTRGDITYANDKFCEISKYSRGELLGKNHRIINSGYHLRDFFTNLWETITHGKVWKGEIRNRAKDGSIYWVYTTIVPFLDGSGRPYQYVSIRHDITEKKLAQEQIERERLRALYSEKMASLGELAAGIAHELGNPLAAIRGRMEFLSLQLQKQHLDKEKILTVTDTVIGLVDRMSKIIRGMKNLARDGSQDPFEKVSVHWLVGDILEYSYEKFHRHGVRLEKGEIPPNLVVECRETQLMQVLVNLLNNACDAVKTLDDKWVRVEARDDGPIAEIWVIDSGHGLSAELRAKVGQPFFTTKPMGQGTGLGLSISKAIMESHGGALEVDPSHPNTCFVIRWPKVKS